LLFLLKTLHKLPHPAFVTSSLFTANFTLHLACFYSELILKKKRVDYFYSYMISVLCLLQILSTEAIV
jgi:hypothetical protein